MAVLSSLGAVLISDRYHWQVELALRSGPRASLCFLGSVLQKITL